MVGNRKFRTFNVIDDCSREALAIEIDTSLSAKRIIRTLNRIGESRGFLTAIRSDNGPEFTSGILRSGVRKKELRPDLYSQASRRKTAAAADRYIERFNRLYREAVLDAYLFFDLDQVRQLTDEWVEEYNERRPHEGLGNNTPSEWRINLEKTS